MNADQIREFKSCYGSTKDTNLATKFGISIAQVEKLAAQYALGKDKKIFEIKEMPRWTPDQLALLRDLYPDTDNEEIARQCGRTVKAVVSKAHILQLRKSPERLQEMGKTNIKLRRDRQ